MTHKQAQAIRKMSDQELMDYVNDTCMSAYASGIEKGTNIQTYYIVRHLIEMISSLPGVGVVTMKRITRLCEKEGYLDE